MPMAMNRLKSEEEQHEQVEVEAPPSNNPDIVHKKWFSSFWHPKCKSKVIEDLLEYWPSNNPKYQKQVEDRQQQQVRFVCISDIHTPTRIKKERIPWKFPPGDVLLVTGDLTLHGTVKEVHAVADWLRETPYQCRVAIAGNHDFCLDPDDDDYSLEAEAALKSACTYLRDSGTVLHGGIHIYGSPVTPEFHSMAFNVARGDAIRDVWSKIPANTDILLTHGPPLGHGDLVHNGLRAGCADLLSCVEQRVRPAYHVFGHIHEAYGATTNGATAFVNAASCNLRYFLANEPLVFDFPLPRPPGAAAADNAGASSQAC